MRLLIDRSGDSYTSTNFNVSGPQPHKANPLGNPNFPGPTSANGPNYIDFLTATYNKSFIETYNMGYGGAMIDQAIISSPFGPLVKSFRDQVDGEFQPIYTGTADPNVIWTSSSSLFIIFFGINDALNGYARPKNNSLNYAEIMSYQNLVNQVRILMHTQLVCVH